MIFKQGAPVLPGLGVPVLPGLSQALEAWEIARSTKLINLGWEKGWAQKCSRFTGGLSGISEGFQNAIFKAQILCF